MIDSEYIVPNSKPVPNKLKDNPLGTPSVSFIVGATGSGKSVTMFNLLIALQQLHQFDTGLFVTGNNRDPILDAIELPITTSPKDLENYIVELKQSKEGTKHILVLDDLQGSKDFNMMLGRSNFVNMLLSHRHLGEDSKKPGRDGLWIIITSQTLRSSFTPAIRDMVKNWFIYYPRRPAEIKNYEDIAQDPTSMTRAMGLVKNAGNHSFLFLNKHNAEKDQYFLGFKTPMRDLD